MTLKDQYAELEVLSNFTFLEGASHPEELVKKAEELGYYAIGISDYCTLAGIVRAHLAARNTKCKYLVGCKLLIIPQRPTCLTQNNQPQTPLPITPLPIIVYPKSRNGYGQLCKLLSEHKQQQNTPNCVISTEALATLKLQAHLIIAPQTEQLTNEPHYSKYLQLCIESLVHIFPKSDLSIAIRRHYENNEAQVTTTLESLSRHYRIACVATNNVHYHCPTRQSLQDILTCIKYKTTIDAAGFLLSPNQERYLKSIPELYHLFRDNHQALQRTLIIAKECSFSLAELTYEYPPPKLPDPFLDDHSYLRHKVFQGAKQRFPDGLPDRIETLLENELQLIKELRYEKYFLTCEEIVAFARSRDILCQGRGAAANSAVCYCLGITAVDPTQVDLLFARFVSKARNEPPDIDIDFEHERREEVIQFIYNRYGRTHAGLTSVVVTYRAKSSIRDVAKAFGMPADTVNMLTKLAHRWREHTGQDELIPTAEIKSLGLNPESSLIRNLLLITKQLHGFPRHLSQHVGGFIVSQQPLDETVPIQKATMEGRSIIEWNKDDIDALGMLKIDVLALGMLTCLRKAFAIANRLTLRYPPLALHTIPNNCTKTYDMICRSDTLGVFQIESRAQMAMLPRLKPRCYYDLVIEVAIVRPGPIQGDMVHPYLRRRNGLERVEFPDKLAEKVLGKTLGVPLFQEQAMRLAIELADFSPEEADQLRRAMAAWKTNKALIDEFSRRIITGMRHKGYTEAFALTCINQIKGFSEYGFPESHAASFAHLIYASAWLKANVPATFSTALLNSQPLGFYAPSQIISDAIRHRIKILPVDINYSDWDYSIERCAHRGPIRVGFRAIHGNCAQQTSLVIAARRKHGPWTSIENLWFDLWDEFSTGEHPIKPTKAHLETLAKADCYQSLGLNSRQALWQIKRLKDLSPLDKHFQQPLGQLSLPLMSPEHRMLKDYQTKGFSLQHHPLHFQRSKLTRQGFLTSKELQNYNSYGRTIKTAGVVIFRQKPGTAKGMVFITLEDEYGLMNVTITPQIFKQHYKTIISSSLLAIEGKLENIGTLIYIRASNCSALT